jgi:hypothetical protein
LVRAMWYLPRTITRWLRARQVQISFICADSGFCVPPSDEELSQECNRQPCETFSYMPTIWGECSKACGGGWHTRTLKCMSSNGYIVDPYKCAAAGITPPATIRKCNLEACETAFYTYSTYSACSKTCDGGLQTRTASCYNADGTAAAEAVCIAAEIPKASLQAPCNTKACNTFTYLATEWGICDKPCGGTRARTVYCVYVTIALTILAKQGLDGKKRAGPIQRE